VRRVVNGLHVFGARGLLLKAILGRLLILIVDGRIDHLRVQSPGALSIPQEHQISLLCEGKRGARTARRIDTVNIACRS
jgi:hypothetical protein